MPPAAPRRTAPVRVAPARGPSARPKATREARGSLGARRSRGSRALHVVVPLAAGAGVVVVVGVVWSIPSWTGWVYAVMSLLTFAVYAKDKAAARDGRWRVAESTLHLVALAGGWPGALLAQQVLRHKTIKASFRATFWCTVVANLVLLAALCSPAAAPLVDGLQDSVGAVLGAVPDAVRSAVGGLG